MTRKPEKQRNNTQDLYIKEFKNLSSSMSEIIRKEWSQRIIWQICVRHGQKSGQMVDKYVSV